jgi:hypothetical protein
MPLWGIPIGVTPQSLFAVYIYLVFSTKDRRPFHRKQLGTQVNAVLPRGGFVLAAAIFRPRLAVHLDPKPAVAGEQKLDDLDFTILISQQILDRNSNGWLHKHMPAVGLEKSLMHGLVQRPSYISS